MHLLVLETIRHVYATVRRYYAINLEGLDPRGDKLFEVCFGDGTWMLEVEAGSEPDNFAGLS